MFSTLCVCLCVCPRACVCACVRVCMCACVRHESALQQALMLLCENGSHSRVSVLHSAGRAQGMGGDQARTAIGVPARAAAAEEEPAGPDE